MEWPSACHAVQSAGFESRCSRKLFSFVSMTEEEINELMLDREALLEIRQEFFGMLRDWLTPIEKRLDDINNVIVEKNIPYMDWKPGIGFVSKKKKAVTVRKARIVPKVYREGQPMHEPLPDLMKFEEPVHPVVEKTIEVAAYIVEQTVEIAKTIQVMKKAAVIDRVKERKRHNIQDFTFSVGAGMTDQDEREAAWEKEKKSGFQFAQYPDVMENNRYSVGRKTKICLKLRNG